VLLFSALLGFEVNTRPTASVPWWVQALDLGTLGLAIVGLSLLIWKGPRFPLGPWVVSLRSPWRLLAWAAGVGILRHILFLRPALPYRLWASLIAFVRLAVRWRPPTPRDVWTDVSGLKRSPALRAAITPFLTSRGAVLLVGALAVASIGYPPDRERPRLADNAFLNLMAKWDAEWYLTIAREGYQWNGNVRDDARLAFFPAYPMASRAAGWFVGSTPLGAALVVFAAFLGALCYLFRLAREDIGASEAEAAVLFLAFSPFAVFYSAIYTESLFLLGAVGAFYHFRRAEWIRASAWGIVVGLTRPNGFLLSVALALAALELVLRARRDGRFHALDWSRVRTAVLVATMPAIGTGIYSIFVYLLTGEPFMWLRLHSHWGRGNAGIGDLVSVHYGWIRQTGLVGYALMSPIDFINSCAGILALAAVWPVTRRLGPGYGGWIAVNVLAALLSGTTLSIARLTGTLFPLFLWLGAVVPARRRASWIAAFATVQGLTAVLFFTWRRFY